MEMSATLTAQPSLPAITVPLQETWKSWESVAVNLTNLPTGINTFMLWEAFKKEGDIISIDIFEGRTAGRVGKGRIRFKPPPTSNIWARGIYHIKVRNGPEVPLNIALECSNYESFVDSPVRPGVRYPSYLEIPAVKLDICVLTGDKSFHVMRTFKDSVKVTINVRHRELEFDFTTMVYDKWPSQSRISGIPEHQSLFRLKIGFIQLAKLWESHDSQSKNTSFLAILESAAVYYRRLNDLNQTFHSATTWKLFDAWSRQTALVHNPRSQEKSTTNLQRTNQIVDIGRWNVFRVTFPAESADKGGLTLLHEILSDHNVPVQKKCPFEESLQKPIPVWSWINLRPPKHGDPSFTMLDELTDQDYLHLSFTVRYQLEVCISNGQLSEFTLTREFVLKLQELGEESARRLLEHVASEKPSFVDPMEIFNLKVFKGVSDSKIPPYCCFMRTARITPSTIYYNTPTVDTSNRIIRHYIEHADHFLRVRFTDEKTKGRITWAIGDSQDEIYTRIKRTLANGITIGDRHYEFLAFGNSQFREHGAYFFAPTPHLNAGQIRAWMGQLSHIRNVAKYAARLGQSFSTTRAFRGCKINLRQIEDISRNSFEFSDGVGKISKFLVSMISEEHDIRTPDGQLPCAFQFRLGGCKGMLVVSSDPGPSEIHYRPSQFKFESPHEGLEIIRSSQLSIATLNRQLILVLSSRGIGDDIFHKKLNQLLGKFDQVMRNDDKATGMLRKYIDPNQMTLSLAEMIDCGFRRTNEPFVYSMLALWKAWHLKLLKEKAKIVIEQGANMLGCLDETGILKGYFKSNRPDQEESLPEIFLQVSQPEKGWTPKVITGVCIVARNPSLHPGDVRVVRAVDVPELRHLRDVVVFPQTGDQDLPSMCSGGDLDGDDYFVFWDQDLIPPKSSWGLAPMRFPSRKAPDLDHEVTVDEVTSFFVTYMKNDILPKIATAHMVWADFLPQGIRDEKCLLLARLHSDAVDYNKTGGAAVMTRDLEPSRWPHFMERKKPASKVYHSRKILGQLYDAVEKINFSPHLSMPFDTRVLNCKPELKALSEDFMEFARTLKAEYDSAMRRIMAQHEIMTEFEVWSTWVLNHNCLSRDYKFHEELARISSALRDGFRRACFEKAGGRFFEALAPLVVAMYRVTHEDLTRSQENSQNDDESDDEEASDEQEMSVAKLPLISFPWIFSEHLGKIAQGHFDVNSTVNFAASKADNSTGQVYTQAEIQQLTADLNIDGWSAKRKNASRTAQPVILGIQETITTSADRATNLNDKDSGIEIQLEDSDNNDQPVLNGHYADESTIKLESAEEAETVDILEGDVTPSSSALNKLINMVGE